MKQINFGMSIVLGLVFSINTYAQVAPITGVANVNLGVNQVSSPASIVNIPINVDTSGMTAVNAAQVTVPLVLANYRFALRYDKTLVEPLLISGNVSGGLTNEFSTPVNANILNDASNTGTLVLHATQGSYILPTGNIHVADVPFVVKENTVGLNATISIIAMDLRTPVFTIGEPDISISGGVMIPNTVVSTQVSIAFSSVNTDTDADGLPDAWELAQFGTLSRDGTGDFNTDGVNDLTEFQIYYSYPRDGDATGDNVLNVADLLLLQRHVHGYVELPDEQKARLDLYPAAAPDGILNIQDIVLMNRRLMGR